jgi:hypothetical protein
VRIAALIIGMTALISSAIYPKIAELKSAARDIDLNLDDGVADGKGVILVDSVDLSPTVSLMRGQGCSVL